MVDEARAQAQWMETGDAEVQADAARAVARARLRVLRRLGKSLVELGEAVRSGEEEGQGRFVRLSAALRVGDRVREARAVGGPGLRVGLVGAGREMLEGAGGVRVEEGGGGRHRAGRGSGRNFGRENEFGGTLVGSDFKMDGETSLGGGHRDKGMRRGCGNGDGELAQETAKRGESRFEGVVLPDGEDAEIADGTQGLERGFCVEKRLAGDIGDAGEIYELGGVGRDLGIEKSFGEISDKKNCTRQDVGRGMQAGKGGDGERRQRGGGECDGAANGWQSNMRGDRFWEAGDGSNDGRVVEAPAEMCAKDSGAHVQTDLQFPGTPVLSPEVTPEISAPVTPERSLPGTPMVVERVAESDGVSVGRGFLLSQAELFVGGSHCVYTPGGRMQTRTYYRAPFDERRAPTAPSTLAADLSACPITESEICVGYSMHRVEGVGKMRGLAYGGEVFDAGRRTEEDDVGIGEDCAERPAGQMEVEVRETRAVRKSSLAYTRLKLRTVSVGGSFFEMCMDGRVVRQLSSNGARLASSSSRSINC